MKAKMHAIKAPVTMAARKPNTGMPVATVVMKPLMAPMSIMPSTPRLSTPARSAVNSPSAASASGVPAATVARMTLVNSVASIIAQLLFRCRAHEADAVTNQHIGRQHQEQQQPLEQAGHRTGQVQRDLYLIAAHVQQPDKQTGQQHTEWLQLAEKGDDDGGETVAGRNVGLQLADRAGNFQQAGQTRQCAAQQQTQPDQSLAVVAGVIRGACG